MFIYLKIFGYLWIAVAANKKEDRHKGKLGKGRETLPPFVVLRLGTMNLWTDFRKTQMKPFFFSFANLIMWIIDVIFNLVSLLAFQCL